MISIIAMAAYNYFTVSSKLPIDVNSVALWKWMFANKFKP